MREQLRAFGRPALHRIGKVAIVLERHFERHRHRAETFGKLRRRHREVGLPRRRFGITEVDLEIGGVCREGGFERSEEHTSELQSLMRISYAVFCLKKKIT